MLEMVHYNIKLMQKENKFYKFLQDQHTTAMLGPVVGFELYTATVVIVILCVCLRACHTLNM